MKYIVIEVDKDAGTHLGVSWAQAIHTSPESSWFGYLARIVAVLDESPVEAWLEEPDE